MLSDDKKILAFAAILPHTPEPKRDCYQKKNLKSQDYQEVMYCYELQVTNFYQGQGLGKKMIKMIHAHTLRLGLDRVVLSCFKKNRIAWKFYTKKHAYIPDYEDSEYGILSIEL